MTLWPRLKAFLWIWVTMYFLACVNWIWHMIVINIKKWLFHVGKIFGEGKHLSLYKPCEDSGCLLNGLLWESTVIIKFFNCSIFFRVVKSSNLCTLYKGEMINETNQGSGFISLVMIICFAFFSMYFCASKKYFLGSISEGIHCFIFQMKHGLLRIYILYKMIHFLFFLFTGISSNMP